MESPTSDGGSPIIDYSVTLRLNNSGVSSRVVAVGQALTAQFTGLVPNTQYNILVTARNAVGSSQARTINASTKDFNLQVSISKSGSNTPGGRVIYTCSASGDWNLIPNRTGYAWHFYLTPPSMFWPTNGTSQNSIGFTIKSEDNVLVGTSDNILGSGGGTYVWDGKTSISCQYVVKTANKWYESTSSLLPLN